MSDSRQLEALTYEWISPVHALLLCGKADARKKEVRRAPMLLAAVVSGPRPVMIEAAHRAFWNIKKDQLLFFCRYFGMGMAATSSIMAILKVGFPTTRVYRVSLELICMRLFVFSCVHMCRLCLCVGVSMCFLCLPCLLSVFTLMLLLLSLCPYLLASPLGRQPQSPIYKALIQRFIPKATPKLMLDILALRVKHTDLHTDILASADITDLIHENDQKEYRQAVDAMVATHEAETTFIGDLVAERRKVHNASGSSSSSNSNSAPTKNASGRKLPTSYPPGNLSQAEMSAFVPEGLHLYRDDVNSRWQTCTKVGNRRKSASFAYMTHGFEQAARFALMWCWLECLQWRGLDTSSCPVRGLFDDEAMRAYPRQTSALAVASST